MRPAGAAKIGCKMTEKKVQSDNLVKVFCAKNIDL